MPDVGFYATIKILREPTTADGFDPVRGTEVTATRRRVLVDRDLPMKDEYRDHVRRLL